MIWKTSSGTSSFVLNGGNIHRTELLSGMSDTRPPLIEAWQKICIWGERLVRKREAAAVRSTSTRPSLMPHLRLPSALRMSSSPSNDSDSTWTPPIVPAFPSLHRDPTLSLSPPSTAQADLSRLTNTLKTLVEVNGQC